MSFQTRVVCDGCGRVAPKPPGEKAARLNLLAFAERLGWTSAAGVQANGKPTGKRVDRCLACIVKDHADQLESESTG